MTLKQQTHNSFSNYTEGQQRLCVTAPSLHNSVKMATVQPQSAQGADSKQIHLPQIKLEQRGGHPRLVNLS